MSRRVATPAEVVAAVRELRLQSAADPDAAALGADMLRIDVLRIIADGAVDAFELAEAVLATVDEGIGGQ